MKEKPKRSVLQRYFVLLSVAQLMVVLMLVVVFYYQTSKAHINDIYYSKVQDIAYSAEKMASQINLEDYINNGAENAEYNRLLEMLTKICIETEITYIYYSVPLGSDASGSTVEHLMIAGDKTPARGHHYTTTGNTPKERENYKKIESVYKGEIPFTRIQSENANGNVMTAIIPVYKDKKIVAVAGADVGLDKIMAHIKRDTLYVVGVIVGIFALFVILYDLLIKRILLKPVIALSDRMEKFVTDKGTIKPDYSKIEISALGEIQAMVDAFNGMKMDIKEYTEHLKEMTAEKERIRIELDLAAKIQQTALPEIPPQNKAFDLNALMKPAREIGGDFYDYFMVDKTHLAIVIADISGKGIPAALMMMKTKTLMTDYIMRSENIVKAIEAVNNTLCKNNDEFMFVTAFLGILEITTGKLTYINAGHNPPAIEDKGVVSFFNDEHDPILGVVEDFSYHVYEKTLEKGTRLLLYTDGVTEAFNFKEELFGEERLLLELQKNIGKSGKETLESIFENVCEFSEGIDQSDDITVLLIRFNGEKKENDEKIQMQLPAETNQLENAFQFFDQMFEKVKGDEIFRNQCALIVEEIFVNICHYAYKESGNVVLEGSITEDYKAVKMTFIDWGFPFNPLEQENPSTPTDTKTQKIGGFGIYITKQCSDEMQYTRTDNKNILEVIKKFA
ncbi:MAG: SpoIIE family protein phosphatase [Eubacterium sp.]